MLREHIVWGSKFHSKENVVILEQWKAQGYEKLKEFKQLCLAPKRRHFGLSLVEFGTSNIMRFS